jgi:hypothetical protein
MLYKVELLVAGGDPKILADVSKVFLFLFTFFVSEGHATFLIKGRIGQYITVPGFGSGNQRIVGRNKNVLAINISDIMQKQIH